MYRQTDLTQDLKLDILELKKDLANIRDENQLQKVKIRKLQNEISRRDRQIEALLDPRKSSFFKKSISERGASMIMNLRQQNKELEKILNEKEALIRRLQSDLQTKKLYTVNFKLGERKKSCTKNTFRNKLDCAIPYYVNEKSSDSEKEEETAVINKNFKSISMQDISDTNCFQAKHVQRSVMNRARSMDRSTHLEKLSNNVQYIKQASNEMKAQYEGLSRDHLLSIIENLKANQHHHRQYSPLIRKGGSPESDLERIELQCETPHNEIQQLQNFFMDMLAEVDDLKLTIGALRSEHQKTVGVLKEKDQSITKLADEIKKLKRPRSVGNIIRTKSSPTSESRKVVNEKKQMQSASKTQIMYTKNFNEEIDDDTCRIDACSFTKVEEIQQKDDDDDDGNEQEEYIIPQIIQVRKGKNADIKELEYLTMKEAQKTEEEMRRAKYNHIMEQMRAAENNEELKMFFCE